VIESQPRGQYMIIRVDGSYEIVHRKPTIALMHAAIGCDIVDVIPLTANRPPDTVMIIDDLGKTNNKPINDKATALYHEVKPQAKKLGHSIHGDVVIVNDEDFE
jgi:hypothetical protein